MQRTEKHAKPTRWTNPFATPAFSPAPPRRTGLSEASSPAAPAAPAAAAFAGEPVCFRDRPAFRAPDHPMGGDLRTAYRELRSE